jgi:hypothetical protein
MFIAHRADLTNKQTYKQGFLGRHINGLDEIAKE